MPAAEAGPAATPRPTSSGRLAAAVQAVEEADQASRAGSTTEDVPAEDDEDAADSGLDGAELVARELGGRVIGEFGAS